MSTYGEQSMSGGLILLLLPLAGIVSVPPFDGDDLPLGLRLAAIMTVVFLASATNQFFRPASSVLLQDIVSETQQPRASGLNQTSQSVALLAGPPLAAPLLIAFGPQWALLFNAGSFFASWLMLRAVRVPFTPKRGHEQTSTTGVWRELKMGMRFFRSSRVLMTLATALVISTFGLGALNALDIFFVTKNLSTSPECYGIMGAAEGGGMLLGVLAASVLATRVNLERMIWGGLAALGLLIVVYARLTDFTSAVVVMFLMGAVVPSLNVAIGPLVLRHTPRQYLGRVMGTLNPLVNGTSIGGLLLAGVLYSSVLSGFQTETLGIKFGPLDSIFSAVGLLLLIGAIYARVNLSRATTQATATDSELTSTGTE